MTEAQKEIINEEYIKGIKSYMTIAAEIGTTHATVRGYIRRAQAKGIIPPKRPKHPPKTKKKKKYGYDIEPKQYEAGKGLEPGESVNCTLKVAQTCIYGLSSEHCGLCDYQARTGHSRIFVAPDPHHCTVYVRRVR